MRGSSSRCPARPEWPRFDSRWRGRRGHTLIEMMIVVAVLAVIASMAMPRVDYGAMRLDGNARKLRGILQQAWRLSIQRQHDIHVSIDAATGRIRTFEDNDNDGTADGGERISWQSLEEGARFAAPATTVSGVSPAPMSGPGVNTVELLPTVTFRRNGSTSGDVELFLNLDYRGTSAWRAITVAPATGRTDWFRLVNGAWRSGGI